MKRTCRGNNYREAAQKENENIVRSGDLLAFEFPARQKACQAGMRTHRYSNN
jgi:hypothetical protein